MLILFILAVHSLSNDFYQFYQITLKCKYQCLLMSNLVSTPSNAALRSILAMATKQSSSNALEIIDCNVPLPFLKPCCWFPVKSIFTYVCNEWNDWNGRNEQDHSMPNFLLSILCWKRPSSKLFPDVLCSNGLVPNKALKTIES